MIDTQLTGYEAIDKSLLSGENYTLSLLNAAVESGILTEDDVTKIQIATVERLGEKVRLYTHGESTSVRSEVAELLMTTILYTVGVALKAADTPEIGAAMLRDRTVKELYEEGIARINRKCAMIRKIGAYLAEAHVPIRDAYYRFATTKFCDKFLRKYDKMYAAMEMPAPDYPLYVPVTDLAGVEYMQKYFENLYRETQIMRLFDTKSLVRTVAAANPMGAPVNAFRPVMIAALSSVILDRDPKKLSGGENGPALLSERFSGLESKEILPILQIALDKLSDILGFHNPSLMAYLRTGLPDIAAEIAETVKIGRPATVFVFSDTDMSVPDVLLQFGKRMSDDAYSDVAYKVSLCQTFDEQKAIIKERIPSLYDLEDIIIDYPFSDKETGDLLGDLKANELAFMLKKHPKLDEVDEIGLSDGEIRLCRVLNQLIALLPEETREMIEKLSLLISDDIYEE